MKKCSKCGEIKDVNGYHKDKSKKDGYVNVCKICRSIKSKDYYQKNKLRISEYNNNYYNNNKDSINDRCKDYYNNNKDTIIESVKLYNNDVPFYSTYSHQLIIDGESRVASDGISLEVKCKYCNVYFKPTNQSVKNRLNCIKGEKQGESHFYCSDTCKVMCPIFNQIIYTKNNKPYNTRPLQSSLRKLVIEKQGYKCGVCGKVEDSLTCHHIDPVKNNPIESADIDNCIMLCKECDIRAHSQPGCSYQELRKC